jgi:hypothetical protein
MRACQTPGMEGAAELLKIPLGTKIQVAYPTPALNRVCIFTERLYGEDTRIEIYLPEASEPLTQTLASVKILRFP